MMWGPPSWVPLLLLLLLCGAGKGNPTYSEDEAPVDEDPPVDDLDTTAPLTAAPPTDAPPTVAPLTVSPLTIAPLTLSPLTVAPSTVAPQTVAPQTAAPSTVSPLTDAPATVSPTQAPASYDVGLQFQGDIVDGADAEAKGEALCAGLTNGTRISCEYLNCCRDGAEDCFESGSPGGREAAALAVGYWTMLLAMRTALRVEELASHVSGIVVEVMGDVVAGATYQGFKLVVTRPSTAAPATEAPPTPLPTPAPTRGPCALLDGTSCPRRSDCFWGHDETCVDAEELACLDFVVFEDCSNFGCEWSTRLEKCGVFETTCADYTQDVSCESIGDECSWTGFACVMVCDRRETETECAESELCEWQAQNETCIAEGEGGCSGRDEESCGTLADECEWSIVTGCSVKSNDSVSTACEAQGSVEACLEFAYCDWAETSCIDRVATAPSQGGGTPASCNETTNETSCLTLGCEWTMLGVNGTCSPAACGTFFTEATCNLTNPRCVFIDNTCYDDCALSTTTAECIANDCSFSSKRLPACQRNADSNTCASQATKTRCVLTSAVPPCVFDDDTRVCRSYTSSECGYAVEQQSCVDHPSACGWEAAVGLVCRACESASGSESECSNMQSCEWVDAACVKEREPRPAVFGMTLSVDALSPGVPFSATIRGKDLSVDDRFAFVSLAAECPPEPQSYPTGILGSTSKGYLTNQIEFAGVGQFRSCYYSRVAGRAIQTTDKAALPDVEVGYVPASSLQVLGDAALVGKESFSFYVVGRNIKPRDRFSFAPGNPGGASCSESMADYHKFRDVSSTTSAEGYFTLDAGRWVLCYASIAWQADGTYAAEHTRFVAVEESPLEVAELADYLQKSRLDELGSGYSSDLGVDLAGINLGSCTKDAEKGLRVATFDVEDHHWGPVSGLSNAGESIDFGSVGSKRYLKGQTCVVPLAPRLAVEDAGGLQSEGKSAVKHLVVSFASFAVDETDTVLVFGDTSKVGIDGVLTEQTDETAELSRGRVAAHTLATPNCPREFNGLDLIASYSGDARPAGVIRARLDLNAEGEAEAVSAFLVVVVCTDTVDRGGTGFSARVGLDTKCPNDCADASGVVRGSCVGSEGSLVGRCACVEGWTGESCSDRSTCQGSQSSSAVYRTPEGEVDVFVAASSTCGFLVQPDPSLNPLNTRFATFDVLIELTANTNISGDCVQNAILIHSGGNWEGPVVKKICPSDLVPGSPVLVLVAATKAYVEVTASLAGKIGFRYKVISTVCPGELGPAGVPAAAAECGGKGTCLNRKTGTAAFGTYPVYAKKCDCDGVYVARTVGESCLNCADGYFKQEGLCVAQVTCGDVGDCGGPERSERCVPALGCVCKEPYHGRNCETEVPADVANTIEQKEEGANLIMRLTFDASAQLANVAPSFGRVDTTRLSCQDNVDEPCLSETRGTGNVYTNERALGGSDTHDSTASMNAGSSATMVYPDRIAVPQVRSEKMDVKGELSVTAWVKLSRQTKGFLVAKADNVLYKSGEHPALDLSAAHITQKAGPAHDASNLVYFGVFLDGSSDSVWYVSQRKASGSSDGEDAAIERKFRIGGDLFDGNWHFFALTVGYSGGRWEGQVFIDGATSVSNAEYVQCLPFLPTAVEPGLPNATHWDLDKGTPTGKEGGMLLVGYEVSGSIDELRVYDKKLSHFIVVEIASLEMFESRLSLAAAVLIAVGVATIIPLSIALCLPVARRCVRNYFASRRRASVAPTEGSWLEDGSSTRVTIPEQQTEARAGDSPAQRAAAEKGTGPGEQSETAKLQGRIAALGHAVAMFRGSGVQAQSGGAGAEAAQGAGGAGDAGGPANAGTDHAAAATDAAASAVGLQLSIIRDGWQMLALLLASWDWPPTFLSVFGFVTLPFSIDLTTLSGSLQEGMKGLSPLEWAFYSASIVCVLAYLVLVMIILLGDLEPVAVRKAKRDTSRMIVAKYQTLYKELEGSEDKKARKKELAIDEKREIEEAGLGKGWSDRLAFGSLFILTTLYLPITRGGVMIMRCHRNVQCIWDCASLSDSEPSYFIAFCSALAACTIISVSAPLFLSYVVHKKKCEFDEMHPNPKTRAAEWMLFVQEDRTVYKDIYAPFEYKFMYFQAGLMVCKAMMCIPTLGLEQNGEEQLICTVAMQAFFTMVMFGTAPFILDACDLIMQVGQVNIMFCLAISCFYRADPTETSYDYIMLSAGCTTIAFQVYQVLFNHSSASTASPLTKLQREAAGSEGQLNVAYGTPVCAPEAAPAVVQNPLGGPEAGCAVETVVQNFSDPPPRAGIPGKVQRAAW
ncbi:hypothetical protein DIPPA_03246 [Diplonema papillatum]|nr:hypothetical protein DIPPA_03246 [Diplonema papillatum]